MFASTTFIGNRDAVEIVEKYVASVAVCRVALMCELVGLRESCFRPKKDDSDLGLGSGNHESESDKAVVITSCSTV